MLALGIETASDDASVAVLDGDNIRAERRWHIDTTTSRELLAAIEAILVDAHIERMALQRIAVDTGPGGYGSLRTGVATAQGMALALGVPLAGIGRLEVEAFPLLAPDTTVVAVHNAGRSGFAWAAYSACDQLERSQAAPPQEVVAPRLDTPEQCARLAPTPARWCGELTAELRTALAQRLMSGDTEAMGTRSAADVVRLADLHRAFGDPAVVDVTYLRPPSIGARARS